MAKEYGTSDPQIAEYVRSTFQPEDDVLRRIREETLRQGMPEIQVSDLDGRLLEVLTRAAHARNAVEVGTLAGYSTVCLARALPADGQVFTLEASSKHAEVARNNIELAGLSQKVQVIEGEASKTLDKLTEHSPFDLVFIDADKAGYPEYFEWAATHLRGGGIVLADNTFAFGKIAMGGDDSGEAAHLRKFNRMVAEHENFRGTIIPTGEGLTMAVKLQS